MLKSMEQGLFQRYLSLLTLLLFSHTLAADPKFRFNGFGTLAITYEGSDELGFSRSYINRERNDISLLPDSIIGFQADWVINDKWDVFSQIVLEDNNKRSLDNLLAIGFLRYRASRKIDLMAGRINPNIYLLSDHKNVSHGYLWARPPIEFYAQSVIVDSVDGVGVNFKTDIAGGYTKIRSVFGRSVTEQGNRVQNTDIIASDIFSISAEWSKQNFVLFTGYTSAKVKLNAGSGFLGVANTLADTPPAILPNAQNLARRFGLNNESVSYISVGAKYDGYPFVVQAEFASSDLNWLITPPTYTGYLSIGYKINDFTPYILAAFSEPKDDVVAFNFNGDLTEINQGNEPDFQRLMNMADQIILATRIDQRTISTGIRYDWTSSLALKFQYDHVMLDSTGSVTLFPTNNNSNSLSEANVNLLHLSVNWVF
ncbi:hypothetical protein J3L16_02595 [Alteromonas sp. 5E99-2]|uniref:hypothetical protein n=1 Tax=Alteromonas sp. 5E99-2 TaxID=2817683 RepID=UPI001A989A86|nr:hypothetical protein [Alteromonas sp. 5E99-2]MBO1254573.1 hypothetical protein [Alteromonas sp. 5E99-2]